ncbi:MAG: RNA polymerase sigma-70 factor [Alistipes sp.]
METTLPIEERTQFFCARYPHNKQKYMRFALMFVREKEAAEDIINDSFINLWENRDNLTAIINIESYFYTIIKNNCRQWIRNKKKQLEIQKKIHDANYWLLQVDLNDLDDYDPNLIFSAEIRAILEKQLMKLPKLTRLVFTENRFDGMTYDEIAKKYNISTRTVTREIQTTLALLRVSLKDYLPIFAIFFSSISHR